MGAWIAILAALVVVGFVWRVFVTRRSKIDAGEVSQNWIVQHRADQPPN